MAHFIVYVLYILKLNYMVICIILTASIKIQPNIRKYLELYLLVMIMNKELKLQ